MAKEQVWRPVLLLLKQVVERGACVRGAAWRRSIGDRVSVVRRSRVARDGHAGLEKLALVRLVLHNDPYWDRLEALEACGRLKVSALLAAMERGAALWAIGFPVNAFGQCRSAVVTARGRYVLNKAGKA